MNFLDGGILLANWSPLFLHVTEHLEIDQSSRTKTNNVPDSKGFSTRFFLSDDLSPLFDVVRKHVTRQEIGNGCGTINVCVQSKYDSNVHLRSNDSTPRVTFQINYNTDAKNHSTYNQFINA